MMEPTSRTKYPYFLAELNRPDSYMLGDCSRLMIHAVLYMSGLGGLGFDHLFLATLCHCHRETLRIQPEIVWGVVERKGDTTNS